MVLCSRVYTPLVSTVILLSAYTCLTSAVIPLEQGLLLQVNVCSTPIQIHPQYVFIRAVHKETEFFKKMFCFTYNLIKLVTFKVLPSTLDTPLPTFFPFLERVLERFAGRREGPVSNFLLFPLPSEIGDLLVRISASGRRKSPQGPNLESRAAGGTTLSCFVKISWIRSDASTDAAQILRQHDASSVFRSKSGGSNFYRFLLMW